jgi:hypothetical protein
MGSDYRSSVVRSRRTTEAVLKRPEELQKLYGKLLQKQCGKIQKNFRKSVGKGSEELQKKYGK